MDIMRTESLMYSPSKVEEAFLPYWKLADSESNCKAVGISYEGLSLSVDGTDVDRGLIAKRLYELFGDAKIMITIRNQFGILSSLYDEFIRTLGCYFSFDEFLEAQYWRFHSGLFSQVFYYDLSLVSGYKSHRVNWLKLGLWDSCKPCFISS